MRTIRYVMYIVQALGLIYLLFGNMIHRQIMGEVASQSYYHNVMGLVALTVFVSVLLVQLLLTWKDPQESFKSSRMGASLTTILIVCLVGAITSHGTQSGVFLRPLVFWLGMPLGMSIIYLLVGLAKRRSKQYYAELVGEKT